VSVGRNKRSASRRPDAAGSPCQPVAVVMPNYYRRAFPYGGGSFFTGNPLGAGAMRCACCIFRLEAARDALGLLRPTLP
jgi:hypothetical protein